MAITNIGTNTSSTGNSSIPLTFNHTQVAGSNRVIVVFAGSENANETSTWTVTYGGQAMTIVEAQQGAGFANNALVCYLFEADLPGDGSNTISVTFSGTSGSLNINAFCAEYDGVTQLISDTDIANIGSNTTITNTITGANTDLLCSTLSSGATGSFTHSDSQNELIDFNASSSVFSATDLLATGAISSLTSTFSSSANRLARACIVFNEAPSGGNYDQTSFRGRNDDGTETTATWKAVANTNWNQRQNTNFRVRFLIQEDDDVEDLNVEYQLQYNLNAAGWNDVNGASAVVRSFTSPNFADGDSCTQQIGAGTFIGSQNGMDEVNGLVGGANMDWSTTINEETEVEFCCQIRGVDTERGDTIELRLLQEPDIDFGTYTSIPTITIPIGAGLVLASSDFFQTTAGSENPGTFNFERSLPWGAITIALRHLTGGATSMLPTDKFTTIETSGTVTVQDGATIDDLIFNDDVVIGTVTDLTNVIVNGDLSITAGGTYNFSNVTVTGDITNDDNTQNVVVIGTNNSSLSTSEPGTGITQVDIQNVVSLIISGMTIGSSASMIGFGGIEDENVLLSGYADSSGILSGTFSGITPQNVFVRARNGGVIAAAIQDDAGAFTDFTNEARDKAGSNDVLIFPATPAVNDAFYMSGLNEFEEILLNVTTAGSGNTIIWEYSQGSSSWNTLSITDNTSSFETTGWNTVTFSKPSDWATDTVNSLGPFFFVRARISGVSAPTQPAAEEITINKTIKYLPFGTVGVISTNTGLTVPVSWVIDTINP